MKLKVKYITYKNFTLLFMGAAMLWLTSIISSCGKSTNNNAINLNIKLQVLNLSPDAYPLDIYFDHVRTNTTHFIWGVNQGYFSVPSLELPYYIKSANAAVDTALISRSDTLKRNVQYSLFITGNVADKSIKTIFTVDTAAQPKVGRGKVRFVDASPSGAAGLDVFANGTKAFSKVLYPKSSDFVELPNGYYDFQINATGSSTVLTTMKNVQIQDGQLYTLYAYGYTTRPDSAAFNAALITNR